MEKSPPGRPREFDPDLALERAMVVFWGQGYEGSSLTDLTEAMGISRKSMYSAFGNKEQLFRKALQRYAEGPGSYVFRAVQAPTARGVAEAFLEGSIRATTQSEGPAGCLGVQGALATGKAGAVARVVLADWRELGLGHLSDRFQRAVDEGDLPPDVDPNFVARYVMTVSNGVAVQAAGGATAEDLQLVARAALETWPPHGLQQ